MNAGMSAFDPKRTLVALSTMVMSEAEARS